jgi:putative intracellular protease/amidase
MPASRRDFLHTAAGAAALGALTPRSPAADAPNLLPTVKLGPHAVTRLILGGNPIYGYSHFNRLFSQHMTDWHTPDRVQALFKRCEQAGLNCFQNSYDERTLADVDRYRRPASGYPAGGIMHWLCLGKPDWDKHPEQIADAARHKPIGIAPHGALADRLHRSGQLTTLTDLLKRIRDTGVLVGLSCHGPALLELAEAKGWDVDYYMTALYHLTRPRAELEKLFGKDVPLGEVYLPSDPPRMFAAIKAVKKPCLVYKVLAAGRRVGSPAEVKACLKTAFENIKPTDALIVGMYQQFGDQVGENAATVRELLRG